MREVIENRGGEDPDVDYPGVVDYFAWVEDHDCCGEGTNHAVDISVHSNCPDHNHTGKSLLRDDSIPHHIDSGCPWFEADSLAGNAAPRASTNYPGKSNLARIDMPHHGDVDARTMAAHRPYSEVDDDHLGEGGCGVVQSVIQV